MQMLSIPVHKATIVKLVVDAASISRLVSELHSVVDIPNVVNDSYVLNEFLHHFLEYLTGSDEHLYETFHVAASVTDQNVSLRFPAIFNVETETVDSDFLRNEVVRNFYNQSCCKISANMFHIYLCQLM